MSHRVTVYERHYTPKNTPPSQEVAIARIKELELVEENIKTQLEFCDPDEHETDKAFFRWKTGATNALSHYRIELKFLRKWMLDGMPSSPSGERYRTALEEVAKSVRQMVEEVKEVCSGAYTEEHLPHDLAAAHERSTQLIPIIERFKELFSDLKKQAARDEIDDSTMVELRRPLSTLFNGISAEKGFLNRFISAAHK